MVNPSEAISLYFHVPFCTQKCAYCHFYVLPDKDPFKAQLMEGFRLEWERWLPAMQGKKIATIYFGGGTPALLGAKAIAEIIDLVRQSLPFTSENPEITIEANPENITFQLMRDYASAGINRVSIGIQTLDNQLLATLQRLHSSDKALDSVRMTADAGIQNISVDLMYDLPGQTLPIWKDTLKEVRELPITHLSLYNLTIEPHTVFFKYQTTLKSQLPDPETSLQMYEMAIEMLAERDLQQYEISAFAKNGMHSEHNVGYWIARPFLGFGPSAFSFWNGRRFRNVANLSRYCKALQHGDSPIDFDEQLDPIASRRELLVIQLRLMSGVNLLTFEQQHGKLDKETYRTLLSLQNRAMLQNVGSHWSLTKRGVLFYDTIASELI